MGRFAFARAQTVVSGVVPSAGSVQDAEALEVIQILGARHRAIDQVQEAALREPELASHPPEQGIPNGPVPRTPRHLGEDGLGHSIALEKKKIVVTVTLAKGKALLAEGRDHVRAVPGHATDGESTRSCGADWRPGSGLRSVVRA